MAQPAEVDFPLKRFLGMKVESDTPGRAIASLDIGDEHMNPFGAAHGAVVFALIDTSMGRATTSTLADDQRCVTTDIHLRFLRPVVAGRLSAATTVVHQGRTLVALESTVTDSDGRVVATGTGSFMITGA